MKVGRIFLSVISVCLLSGASDKKIYDTHCNPADNVEWVVGGTECLKIKTNSLHVLVPNPTLVVFIHGDVGGSRTGATQLYGLASQTAYRGVVTIALMRPGYLDDEGNRSTGWRSYRRGNYTKKYISSVATAVRTLKKFHGARRVIIVGFSGGAAYAGVMIGRFPDLVDGVVLTACPCNIESRQRYYGTDTVGLESPHSFVGEIKKGAKVIAITGSEDKNTVPRLAMEYIKELQQRGIDAKFVEAAGANHDGSLRSWTVPDAIDELIDALRKR